MILGLPKDHDFFNGCHGLKEKLFKLAGVEAPTTPMIKELLADFFCRKEENVDSENDGQ